MINIVLKNMIEELKIRGFDTQDNDQIVDALLEIVEKLNEVIRAVNELEGGTE
jgi:hypothetical protein